MNRLTRNLLLHQILNNPLPWRVEIDWANEVTASNGVIIAKCLHYEEAREIIDAAESLQKEIDDIDIESLFSAD